LLSCFRVKRFRLAASYFSLIAPKEKVTKRKGAFPIRANSVVELIGHFQTRHPWLDLETARILRAALRVGATIGAMVIFSSKGSTADYFEWPMLLWERLQPRWRAGSPLTPDHNAVASKDKRLSPPSADPEGGAQDARRFPIESG
jgi:hypothetical protein